MFIIDILLIFVALNDFCRSTWASNDGNFAKRHSELDLSAGDEGNGFIFERGITADFQAKKNLSIIAFGSCR